MSKWRESAPRTLVLYAQYTDRLSYYDDWLDAFKLSAAFNVESGNICDPSTLDRVKNKIGDYELIVILHSANGDTTFYIRKYAEILKKRKCRLLSFVGNEVNILGISMVDKIAFLREVEADLIATQLPLEAGQWLYAECAGSRVVALPHALNPAVFQPLMPNVARPIDIGVRTNRYSAYLGDNERNELLALFSTRSFRHPLTVDIDTENRFDRSNWASYLNRCKGTIANEAGSYYLERDDRTVLAIRAFAESTIDRGGVLVVKSDSTLLKLWLSLPELLRRGVKRAIAASGLRYESEGARECAFEVVFERFFKDYPRHPFNSKAISSRHFDAIGTKTCQILLEGTYNGILQPNLHYLALRKDFSNIDEVVENFLDDQCRSSVIENAYAHVMEHHTYSQRIAEIRRIVDA